MKHLILNSSIQSDGAKGEQRPGVIFTIEIRSDADPIWGGQFTAAETDFSLKDLDGVSLDLAMVPSLDLNGLNVSEISRTGFRSLEIDRAPSALVAITA